jgi:hypothetical protein
MVERMDVDDRVAAWAQTHGAKQAVMHALALLHGVLGRQVHSRQRPSRRQQYVQYSVRCEHDPHRPFMLYYAALTVWAFARACNLVSLVQAQSHLGHPPACYPQQHPLERNEFYHVDHNHRHVDSSNSNSNNNNNSNSGPADPAHYARVVDTLGEIVGLGKAGLARLGQNVGDVLGLVGEILGDSGSEVLRQGADLLRACRGVVVSSRGGVM